MSVEADWAVVVTPVDGEGGGAWGPFASKDTAEQWLNRHLDSGGSTSEAFYERGYVVRVDNPV
jgi:hypothetical protein